LSEQNEPVTVEFGSPRAAAPVTEEECICAPNLAAHLMSLLYTDSNGSLRPLDSPVPASA